MKAGGSRTFKPILSVVCLASELAILPGQLSFAQPSDA